MDHTFREFVKAFQSRPPVRAVAQSQHQRMSSQEDVAQAYYSFTSLDAGVQVDIRGHHSYPYCEVFFMTKFADHDAYISAAPEAMQPLLAQIRAQLAKAIPDAEEIIAYDMPGFGFGGTIVAGYAAFSKQCGLYVNKGAITAHADDIATAGLKATKTGVTFSPGKPIPDKLVKKLAIASRKELGL